MKLIAVLSAQSVAAVRVIGGDFGWLPAANAALAQEYNFVGTPEVSELTHPDPTKGMTFRQGMCEVDGRAVVIEFLQIFPSGLSVTTRTNTSESDLALRHVMEWAKSKFKVELEYIRPGIGHSSQVEIRFEQSLTMLLPHLRPVGSAITEKLDDFWEVRPLYETIGLNFGFDKTRFPAFAPSVLRIERRENMPFSQQIYFSEAPLSTDQHLAVLDALERACLSERQ